MLTITAHNPNGLDFEFATEDASKIKGAARTIKARGGVDIRVNGRLIPEELFSN